MIPPISVVAFNPVTQTAFVPAALLAPKAPTIDSMYVPSNKACKFWRTMLDGVESDANKNRVTKMPVSIEPPHFVLPPGPKIVVVRIDRYALQHLDPSIDPLTDTDSFSRILRKGKAAFEQARCELSTKLFGADLPRAAPRIGWPEPGLAVTMYSDPLFFRTRYVGFYFKQDVPAGELRPAVFELTSERDPVDNCLQFRAVEADDYLRNARLEIINRAETTMAIEAGGV